MYSFTTTITAIGSGDYLVQIDELEASATSEATINGVPPKGSVRGQKAQLISGTGTTIDPVLGSATNPAGSALTTILSNGTAAAAINNVANPAIPYYDSDGSLFHRSVCDAGADNTVTTVYLISAGL
jgi:hypothetical protein